MEYKYASENEVSNFYGDTDIPIYTSVGIRESNPYGFNRQISGKTSLKCSAIRQYYLRFCLVFHENFHC